MNSRAGADYRAQDIRGRYAFDYISDHKEWIDSGHFNDEVRARLKGIMTNYILNTSYLWYLVSIQLKVCQGTGQVDLTNS